jgi:hypothetical protein
MTDNHSHIHKRAAESALVSHHHKISAHHESEIGKVTRDVWIHLEHVIHTMVR